MLLTMFSSHYVDSTSYFYTFMPSNYKSFDVHKVGDFLYCMAEEQRRSLRNWNDRRKKKYLRVKNSLEIFKGDGTRKPWLKTTRTQKATFLVIVTLTTFLR